METNYAYDELEIALGEAIRKARIRKGMPLEDVAARANLSPTSVRALELGRGSTISTLVKVLRVLGETGLITDFAAAGRDFSPIAALREAQGRYASPKRASSRRGLRSETVSPDAAKGRSGDGVQTY